MMRKVEWSTGASRDYLELFSYIAADNPVAANRVGRKVLDCAKRLGQMATGRRGRVTGTYEKVVPRLPYIIVYTHWSPATGMKSFPSPGSFTPRGTGRTKNGPHSAFLFAPWLNLN